MEEETEVETEVVEISEQLTTMKANECHELCKLYMVDRKRVCL